MIRFITKLPKNSSCLVYTYKYGFGLTHLNYIVRNLHDDPMCPKPKPKKKHNTGTLYTIGALTLVGVATVGYASYDPEFRKMLGENVPGADGFLKFILQEEKSYYDSIMESLEGVRGAIGGSKKRKFGALPESDSIYTPPRAVFPSLIKEEKEEKFNEIRMQKDSDTVNVVKEKPAPVGEFVSATHPKSIAELEKKIQDAACAAVNSYNKARTALIDYSRDIEVIVEDSVERLDPNIWESLKKKTTAKNEMLEKAEKNAESATNDLEGLASLLDDPEFNSPETARAMAKRNITRILGDIKKAKLEYEEERKLADITEKYWKKVEAARCHFVDELDVLFPGIDISKKKLNLKPSEMDLFIIHAFAHVLYYQKELSRVETIGQARLKSALEGAKKGDPNFSLVETAIKDGIEAEKRKLNDEYARKCLALRKESERELRHRLRCQEQAHVDHLQDVLQAREAELERDFGRRLDEQLATEQAKYKLQLAGLVARMKGMRNAIMERVEADKIAHQSQVLWSACQALHRAVKSSIPGIPFKDQVRPLKTEVTAIKKAAAEGDELVDIVVKGIPKEAVERGVFPEDAIRERFLKVERVARRLALIPECGARLPMYLLSFIQSALLISSPSPIPQAELQDDTTDFTQLDTYDILQRARYWLDRGNYAQTLRYMNLLKGASRCVADEWMRETRILLETQQAAETLMAHAVAGGLQHL